jgi:hypothetical protein
MRGLLGMGKPEVESEESGIEWEFVESTFFLKNSKKKRLSSISCSRTHSAAVANHEVFIWGSYGAHLGLGETLTEDQW